MITNLGNNNNRVVRSWGKNFVFETTFGAVCAPQSLPQDPFSYQSLFPADIIIPENGEPVSSKDIKRCIQQIQELIISRLNQAVANKLISSVDYLRESFVGTLERCLKSLEESWEGSVHPPRGLDKGREGSMHITSNYLKQVWEQGPGDQGWGGIWGGGTVKIKLQPKNTHEVTQ